MARIHLILGPTGVGKTSRSVDLAARLSAPVIVLDRIQIYPELSTGSGRPRPEELRGTERLYLTERRVADGELSAAESQALLLARVEELRTRHTILVMEGGSISLMQEICAHSVWRSHQLTLHYTPAPRESIYRELLQRRIRAMLQPSPGQPSILSELAAVWGDERAQAFVETIGGYHTLVAWCRERGISPADIESHAHAPDVVEVLLSRMLEANVAYGYSQGRAFARLLPLLQSMKVSERAPAPGKKEARE